MYVNIIISKVKSGFSIILHVSQYSKFRKQGRFDYIFIRNFCDYTCTTPTYVNLTFQHYFSNYEEIFRNDL